MDQAYNSRTKRYISTLKNEEVPDGIKSITQRKHPSQVMVSGLVVSNGLKIPPLFLLSGFRKVAKVYLDKLLRPHAIPWIQDNFGVDQNYLLMQNKAPCHTANAVRNWLQESFNFGDKDL